MKYVFTCEQTFTRDYTVEGINLAEALDKVYKMIDNDGESFIQDDNYFCNGELRMRIDRNFLPQVRLYGETIEIPNEADIVIDMW